MGSRTTELRVGITVVLSIIALVVGVAWVGEYKLTREGYSLDVRFDDVGALNAGDPVTVAGVESGKVQQIALEPEGVRVTLWLGSKVVLEEDARIAVENVGMMGEKYVAIRRGTSPRKMDLTRLQEGVYRPGLMEMMAELGDLLPEVRRVLGGLDQFLAGPSGRPFGETLAALENTLDELSQVIAENRGDVRDGVRGFREASGEARALIGDLRTETSGAIGGVNRATAGVAETTDEMRELVKTLQEVAGRIESGEGSLGRVVNDQDLHDELVVTLRDLQALLEDLRKNPKKYFGVSVF